MNDSNKSSLDRAIDDLQNYAKNSSSPDVQAQINRLIKATDIGSAIRVIKSESPQFPDSLLQNLLKAASATQPQLSRTTTPVNEPEERLSRGRGVGVSILALPFVKTASMQRRANARLRFKKALRKEAIRQATDDRTSEAYKLSEDYVFKKWCKQAKIKQDSTDEKDIDKMKKFRESEYCKNRADEQFAKKNQKTINEKVVLEKTRIYENPKDDPLMQELGTLFTETHKEHLQKTIKQKRKDPGRKKANKDILSVFAKEYSEKANAYSKWYKKTKDEGLGTTTPPGIWLALGDLNGLMETTGSIESPQQPTSYREDDHVPAGLYGQPTSSPGGGAVSNQLQNLAQKGVSKALEEPAEQAVEKGLMQGAGQAIRAGASALVSAAGSALGGVSWPVWVGVGILIIILVLIIIFSGGGGDENQTLRISKSVTPSEVPNLDQNNPVASQFTYTISVSYSGQGGQLVVEDPIPENADFVSADNNATLIDASGNETTNISEVKSVMWTVDEGGNGPTSSSGLSTSTPATFDPAKFTGYGFPPPQDPNPVSLSSLQLELLARMHPFALSAASQVGVDIGILEMWTIYEGIPSTLYDNCDDHEFNGNTPCNVSNNNWQVGYGVRPLETTSYLSEAILKTHPGETIQQIGQAVIDTSKNDDPTNQIINPTIFPDVSLNEIINGAKNNISQDRQLLGILMKDDEIGTYVLAKVFKNITGPRMASTMEGWPGGYNRQKIINYIKAVYDADISSVGTLPKSATNIFTLTLQPKPDAKDTYIINQATGEVVGGNGPATGSGSMTIVLDPGHSPSSCPEVQQGLVTVGASGEMAINWQMAQALEPKLQALGYNVVLTKQSLNDCVSDKARAEIANNNNSALFFRIHLNTGSDCHSFMLTPQTTSTNTGLPTSDSISKGNQAAHSIISAIDSAGLGISSTTSPFWPDSRAGNEGMDPNCPSLLIGSCYAKVPVTLIEMSGVGCFWLSNSANQDKMATALANGIKNFTPITQANQNGNATATNVVGTNGNTPIKGVWGGTATQLADFFTKNNPSPKFTVSVQQLAQYYIDYSAQAGLRADILWAQMIKETGWGNYSGDVGANQNNFAGLGATGGGAQGATFTTASDGVKAQVAHMFAYVFTSDQDQNLPWRNMDPRFNLVSPRGQVNVLSDLNGRWAVPGAGYGQSIENTIRQINP